MDHLQGKHDRAVNIEKLNFESMETFNNWKEEETNLTMCSTAQVRLWVPKRFFIYFAINRENHAFEEKGIDFKSHKDHAKVERIALLI